MYQLAIEATFKNLADKRSHHFGVKAGARAKQDYCCSRLHKKFDFDKMYEQALEHGLNRSAGEMNEYDPDGWSDWVHVKTYNVYVILWRTMKERKLGVRHKVPDIIFKKKVSVVKKVRKAKEVIAEQKKIKALEKKYPSPKKYTAAMKKLHKENVAKETRRIKREKVRALKRKKSK